MDAYSLAFAALLLASGALADRHGRRRALLLGNVGFALASLLCGLAWDGPALLAARALKGAAAALVITGGLALLSGAYLEPARRSSAFAAVGIISGAAMALGPSLGGLVAAAAGWRWIFFLNLPVCALAAVLVPKVVAEVHDPEGRPLDWPAVVLLTLALALPVQALLHAGGSAGWRWAGIAAGLAFGAALVHRQRHQARPALDVGLLAKRGPVGVGGVLVALSVSYWAPLIYLLLFLTGTFGLSSERTGLAMLAVTLPMLVLPPLGVRLARRVGWRPTFTAALLVLAAGMGGVALAAGTPASTPALAFALGGMALAGTGAGLINSQVSGALVAMAPPARAGTASGVATTLRQGGFALGIALLGAASSFAGSIGGLAFAAPFAVAALVAAMGALAAAMLLGDGEAPRGP